MLNVALLSHPRISWNVENSVNVVTDGNSLVILGGGVIGIMMESIPFEAHSLSNTAINGQTIAQMIAASSDTIAAHVDGKQNILFAQEATNSIGTGVLPSTAVDQTLTFFDNMKSAKNWACLIVGTAPPAWNGDNFTQDQVNTYNSNIDDYNEELRLRINEVEGLQLLDNRASGMPFDSTRFPNYLRSTFFSSEIVNGYSNDSLLVTEGENDLKVHYTSACRELMAPLYANLFRRYRRMV
jgi:hypothetical protein